MNILNEMNSIRISARLKAIKAKHEMLDYLPERINAGKHRVRLQAISAVEAAAAKITHR